MMNGKLNKTEGFAILISENISVHSLYEIRLGLIENFGMTRGSESGGSRAGRNKILFFVRIIPAARPCFPNQ